MIKLKLLCVGLIASAIFAAPAVAREKHVLPKKTQDAYASALTPASTKSRPCVRELDVGSFATAPWKKPPCVTTGY
jgi:hypothetical protein